MRWSWNPSIKPIRDDHDHKVYLVVDGFGHNGRSSLLRSIPPDIGSRMPRKISRWRFCAVPILPGTSYHHRYRRSSTATSIRIVN
jgi:hypothetical protein